MLISLLFFSSALFATEPKKQEWTVENVKREALVALPDKPKVAPLVFVWHGHGGTMGHAARTMNIHTHWPEAICVYPQGLNTVSPLVDIDGKKPGWQTEKGLNDDRDLKFFDTMLAWAIKEYQIDEKRVFSTGHSNGGAFTYQLWAYRGDKFTAMAPSAAPASPKQARALKPKPVLHFAGDNDPLVKYEWQTATLKVIKKLNGVESDGKPWHDEKNTTIFKSNSGTPVITFIHQGGHKYPTEAPKLIAQFFKEQTNSN